MAAPFPDEASSSEAPGRKRRGTPTFFAMRRIPAELPRPRPVRMSRRGKMIAMMVLIALLASLGIYAATGVVAQRAAGEQYASPSQFPTYAVSIAFVAVFAIVMLNVVGRR